MQCCLQFYFVPDDATEYVATLVSCSSVDGLATLVSCSNLVINKFLNINLFIEFLQMTSVERIVEYSELPSEAALESTDGKQPAVDWPRTGSVIAKDVVLKYNSDGPVVLDHLNFSINPGEKVICRYFHSKFPYVFRYTRMRVYELALAYL